MKKITREEFDQGWYGRSSDAVWAKIEALQTELETRGQGMTVDWSKAPEWAIGANVIFTETGSWSDLGASGNKWKHEGRMAPIPGEYIPRQIPTKVQRVRTTAEKRAELIELVNALSDPDEIDDLCTAAGISLTVLEEV